METRAITIRIPFILGLIPFWPMLPGCHVRPDLHPNTPPALAASLPPAPAAYSFDLPKTAARITMTPVPMADHRAGGFWMSTTEIPWEAYDIFVYRLDEEGESANSDAETRPSKPYIPPDRGFGHSGFPAISMSFHGARTFCEWLSRTTGNEVRLPTEAEWEHACRTGGGGASLQEHAWYFENSDETTHPIGTKQPNRYGLFDMLGNVAEWCVGSASEPVARGGSYLDDLEDLRCDARRLPSDSWNASDPQIPKSRWWLADGPFVGFRIVRDFPLAWSDRHEPSAEPE